MRSAEIAQRWLRFFSERGHTVVPSASLIADDPTLLLVNAGMVPFKPYFLGEVAAPHPRAVSVQKCVRTVDIEEVGRTARHASFFQMCGNFSFGDYFKQRAIPLAWELLTSSVAEGGYGLDGDRLWVTVYTDDDEAEAIWRDDVGVPAARIQRLGKSENFWSMGVPGPCGPSSEICYDRGPAFGPDGGPAVDGERFVELWNLVFMQYERGAGSGKDDFPILGDLPARNIDTGMGLERMAALLQGVDTIFEIDTMAAVVSTAAQLSGTAYGAGAESDVRLRVVADHARTAVMLASDGVTPGNDGRGYVLRRILRRAVRAMRLLGADHPVVADLVASAVAAMGEQYPELTATQDRVTTVLAAEEASFLGTLRAGTTILDTAVVAAKAAGESTLSGATAFRLHDTDGFPIDLTIEMAAEQGLAVDEDGFRRLMREQRERAKADAKAKKTAHADLSVYRAAADATGAAVEFTGYTEVVSTATVMALVAGGTLVPAVATGAEVEVVLDRTPFYAEGGGQLADEGLLLLGSGAVLEVLDVQTPVAGLVVHRARVVDGEATTGQSAQASVDVARRAAISRAHTATHMVHKAFREALGDTATQMGSENSPGRLRFDFPSPRAVPPSVLVDVEARVNDVLVENLAVHAAVMSQDEAQALGAMALFGEKYGERVRVVSVGEWARELCGGTHLRHTGELGLVTIVHEASIGAGVRRVEALVGADAHRFLAREHLIVSGLSEALKARPEELPERVDGLLARLRDAERALERHRAASLLEAAPALVAAAQPVGGGAVVAAALPEGTDADGLRRLALDVRTRLGEGAAVVALGAVREGRPVVVVATSPAAREQGLAAGDLVRVAAGVLGGGGGGKADVAQGGGVNPAALGEALDAVRAEVVRVLGV